MITASTELKHNPENCPQFRSNQFKPQNCMDCGLSWLFHLDVIDGTLIQNFKAKDSSYDPEKNVKNRNETCSAEFDEKNTDKSPVNFWFTEESATYPNEFPNEAIEEHEDDHFMMYTPEEFNAAMNDGSNSENPLPNLSARKNIVRSLISSQFESSEDDTERRGSPGSGKLIYNDRVAKYTASDQYTEASVDEPSVDEPLDGSTQTLNEGMLHPKSLEVSVLRELNQKLMNGLMSKSGASPGNLAPAPIMVDAACNTELNHNFFVSWWFKLAYFIETSLFPRFLRNPVS